jgi:uncharacterized protein YgiM (DUF1202 family)
MADQFKLRWPVDDHTITQRFGENPQTYSPFGQAGHEGLDFVAPVGANIYACAEGDVFEVHPDDGNAYGLHVRIRHGVDGQEYHTVYAHLSKASVAKGQHVTTGERIGLAGISGHTKGPHLHLTLKLIGAKTPGYPDGIIDPLPYLQEGEPPTPSGLTVYTSEQVRLRTGPSTSSAQLAWLEPGEALAVLGDAATARAKVGQQEQWLQVRRANGMDGFVAAWYVQLESPAWTPPEPRPEPAQPPVVYAAQPLNVRKGPSTGSSRVAIALPHEPLAVIGGYPQAARVGDRGAWLQVRLPYGLKGYVAAWYVQTQPGTAPAPSLTVYPTEDLNLREQPAVGARLITQIKRNTPLTVHDDPARAQGLVGHYDEWLYVETVEGQRGWVAAWYVAVNPV